MANQDAAHDSNKWPAMIAHTGTAGTAETVRVVASTDGALRVDLVSGDTINIGTMTVGTVDMLKAGTISKVEAGSISVIAGTINTGTIDLLKAGTITALANGTIGAGTLNTLGTVSKLESGSISVISGTGIVTGGSIAVTAGTIYGTVTNVEEDYAIRIDEANSTTTYYGYALPVNGGSPAEAVWKILRKRYDATSSVYTYADSDKSFNNVWDNRATLSY